jgi:release factor glutamine methyltransferase
MAERRGRWTLLEVLEWTRGHFAAKGVENPRLDAEVLLAHVLETERVMLYARFDQPMAPDELAKMRQLVARRAAGVPVAHLVGRREFWSLDLVVTADVLVPRPETEVLVEVARRRRSDAQRIIDVGTGSGAALFALLSELPEARGFGTEVSPPAAGVARENAARLGLADRAEIVLGHLLEPLPPQALPAELVVANLPYIPSRALGGLAREVRDHEPHLALDGGADGLELIRELLPGAREALGEDGVLVLEADPEQAPALRELLEDAGFEDVETARDLAGRDRVTSARRAAAGGA